MVFRGHPHPGPSRGPGASGHGCPPAVPASGLQVEVPGEDPAKGRRGPRGIQRDRGCPSFSLLEPAALGRAPNVGGLRPFSENLGIPGAQESDPPPAHSHRMAGPKEGLGGCRAPSAHGLDLLAWGRGSREHCSWSGAAGSSGQPGGRCPHSSLGKARR